MTIYIKEYFRNTMWMKQIQIRIKIKMQTKYLRYEYKLQQGGNK